MSKAQLREVVFPLLVKQSLHFIHQHGGEREAPIVSISSMMKHVCPSNSVFVILPHLLLIKVKLHDR